MELSTKIRLGVIGLLVFTILVAWVGYISNNDSLMDFGIMSTFVAILISVGSVIYIKNQESKLALNE